MTGNPNDQADGFSDSNDDWGRREAMGAYDDVWDFLYSLERLSALKEWGELRSDLAAFRGDIPFHDFSETTFRRAAAAGHVDILETMLAKKFSLPDDVGALLVEYLASACLPQAENAIRFLIEKGYTGDAAVLGIAERGSPAIMEMLKGHGCDLLQDDASFKLALHAGNAAMMRYLYDQGADIYTPSAVRGLHGGIESFQSKNRDHVAGGAAAARQLHAALCDLDAQRWLATYRDAAGESPSLAALRAPAEGAADRGMTLMQLAARAGCVPDIVAAALRETKAPLTAADLLRPCESGASVLSVLAARGEAQIVLDAQLWWKTPEEAGKLHDALKDMGAGHIINPAGLAADLQRCRLKATARQSKVRLRPGP